MDTIIPAVASVLVALILVGGTVTGCQMSNQQYYAAQKICVENGGSWVPYGNATSNDAQCLKLR